jgi:thymidylate synthase (FAD)
MKLQVLDHGYVEFVEAWGGGISLNKWNEEGATLESGIIEAARQSTQGSFRGWDQDKKLLSFLFKNNHLTPFEFAGMVIEVQAPIFVLREWHRHRTQSYNEMSARYAPLPDLYYVPTIERVMMNGGANKQAQGTKEVTFEDADYAIRDLQDCYTFAEAAYQRQLKDGIPKELARLVMPVGHYTRMRASANLRNWLQFLTLRLDPAAQWEIRQFAEAVAKVVAEKFPQVWSLFEERSHGK